MAERLNLLGGDAARDVFDEQEEDNVGGVISTFIQDGAFKATLLEKKVNRELGNMTKCKTFVCAIPPDNMAVPRRFRTYRGARNETLEIPGIGGIRERFCDAGLRCNNPSWEALNEAKDISGVGRKIGLMLSIGTGHPGTIHYSKPDKVEKAIPLKLINTLSRIATDCENVFRDFTDRFRFQ
ncbi:hypothetical protein M422DRAFT_246418 [Sphaerobolus stellatus SS14]|nr:hypothetical protein M422DRAFT_246418 [Sphaerobolus stellatus SS14]